MDLQRILVAIKPWQRGLPLSANHARQLAQAVGAQIQLISTVFDARLAARRERGDFEARVALERALDGARTELERIAKSMRDWGANVVTRTVWGVPPYEAILRAVRDWSPDLLVVGVHEAPPFHTRLTDTDWQLMRRTPCPLLLVKSAGFAGYRTIVAAVDPLHAHGEPDGLDRAVLAAGRRFARAFGSRLRAVYAYPGREAFELASTVQVTPGVLYSAENVEAVHRRAVNELAVEYGVDADSVDLVQGIAPEVVIETATARHAELLVVGAPQHQGALAALLGSTAEAVAAEAACDVLLVPPGPHALRRPSSQIG